MTLFQFFWGPELKEGYNKVRSFLMTLRSFLTTGKGNVMPYVRIVYSGSTFCYICLLTSVYYVKREGLFLQRQYLKN